LTIAEGIFLPCYGNSFGITSGGVHSVTVSIIFYISLKITNCDYCNTAPLKKYSLQVKLPIIDKLQKSIAIAPVKTACTESFTIYFNQVKRGDINLNLNVGENLKLTKRYYPACANFENFTPAPERGFGFKSGIFLVL